jgi:hypothetical protein
MENIKSTSSSVSALENLLNIKANTGKTFDDKDPLKPTIILPDTNMSDDDAIEAVDTDDSDMEATNMEDMNADDENADEANVDDTSEDDTYRKWIPDDIREILQQLSKLEE